MSGEIEAGEGLHTNIPVIINYRTANKYSPELQQVLKVLSYIGLLGIYAENLVKSPEFKHGSF
jgi:hypothetical protein